MDKKGPLLEAYPLTEDELNQLHGSEKLLDAVFLIRDHIESMEFPNSDTREAVCGEYLKLYFSERDQKLPDHLPSDVLKGTAETLGIQISRLPFMKRRVPDPEDPDSLTSAIDLPGDPVPLRWIVDLMNSPDQTLLILEAGTGSGKSTMIPSGFLMSHPYLVDEEGHFSWTPDTGNRQLLITQPRKFNVQEVAGSVAKFTGNYTLGPNNLVIPNRTTIGEMTGEAKLGKDASVVFITEGTLSHLVKQDLSRLQKWVARGMPAKGPRTRYIAPDKIIVIDEVHERNLETDRLIYEIYRFLETVKKLQENGVPGAFRDVVGDFKLIIMSATFRPQEFLDYFQLVIPPDRCQIRKVRGTAARVITRWPEVGYADVYQEAGRLAAQIHLEDPGWKAPGRDIKTPRDIIIFVPSAGVNAGQLISRVMGNLCPVIDEGGRPIGNPPAHLRGHPPAVVILVHGNMANRNVTKLGAHLFGSRGNARRKVFIATDFAETGITFSQPKFVIDTGLRNSVTFDVLNGLNRVEAILPISKNSSRQRRGRVGRVSDGYFYPLYTQEAFNQLPDDNLPKILMSDITDLCMEILAEGHDPLQRNLLTRITPEQLTYSYGLLMNLGFIRLLSSSLSSPSPLLLVPEPTRFGTDFPALSRIGSPERAKCLMMGASLDPSIIRPLAISFLVETHIAGGMDVAFPAFVAPSKESTTPSDQESEPLSRLYRSDYLNYYEFYRQYKELAASREPMPPVEGQPEPGLNRIPAPLVKDVEKWILVNVPKTPEWSAFHRTLMPITIIGKVYQIDTDLQKVEEAIMESNLRSVYPEAGPDPILTHLQQQHFVTSLRSGFRHNRARLSSSRSFYRIHGRGGMVARALSIYANPGPDSTWLPSGHQRARFLMFTSIEFSYGRDLIEYPVLRGITVLDSYARITQK